MMTPVSPSRIMRLGHLVSTLLPYLLFASANHAREGQGLQKPDRHFSSSLSQSNNHGSNNATIPDLAGDNNDSSATTKGAGTAATTRTVSNFQQQQGLPRRNVRQTRHNRVPLFLHQILFRSWQRRRQRIQQQQEILADPTEIAAVAAAVLLPKAKSNITTTTKNSKGDANITPAAATNLVTAAKSLYNPLDLYLRCMGIVLVWVSVGTLFYSFCNNWPLHQAFFYAVDAGMSIGFCTQVSETKLLSKAFTVCYILLGASVIGGALALFLQEAVEGLSTPSVQEYQVWLEKQVFDQADLDRTGVLNFDEFRTLIRSAFNINKTTTTPSIDDSTEESQQNENQVMNDRSGISEQDIQQLWNKFDRLKDGVIHMHEFVGTYRGIDQLVQSLKQQQEEVCISNIFTSRALQKLQAWIQMAWQLENRIYVVFFLWLFIGIAWGMLTQQWDIITATHFAVSALATGGLTAPQVDPRTGILDVHSAIFCGVFCLLGIPLFALTLGHFAKVLVDGQAKALEASALTRPLSQHEYDLARRLATARNSSTSHKENNKREGLTLSPRHDSLLYLSDFIVLQLLRQGKLTVAMVEILKHNFESLDKNNSGALSLEEAIASI